MGSLKLVCLFAVLAILFLNGANAILPLSSPGKGEILDTLTPTFSWQKSNLPGIAQYMVTIWSDPSSIRQIYSSPGLESTFTTYTMPSGILKPNYLTGTNTPYYWQVWGRNSQGFNDKSEIRDFWIRGTATSGTSTTSETAKCYKDEDCGANQWEGESFCLSDYNPELAKQLDPNNTKVYKIKRINTCVNPGTKEAACSGQSKAEDYEQCKSEEGERCKKQSAGGAICEIQVSDPCANNPCKPQKIPYWNCDEANNRLWLIGKQINYKCQQSKYNPTKPICIPSSELSGISLGLPPFEHVGNICRLSEDGKIATYTTTLTDFIPVRAFSDLIGINSDLVCTLIDNNTKAECTRYTNTDIYSIDLNTFTASKIGVWRNIPKLAWDVGTLSVAALSIEGKLGESISRLPIIGGGYAFVGNTAGQAAIRLVELIAEAKRIGVNPNIIGSAIVKANMGNVAGAIHDLEIAISVAEFSKYFMPVVILIPLNTSAANSEAQSSSEETGTSITIDFSWLNEFEKTGEKLTGIDCIASDDKIEELECYAYNTIAGGITNTYLMMTYAPNVTTIKPEGSTFAYRNINLTFLKGAVSEDTIIRVKDESTNNNFAIAAYQDQKLLPHAIYDFEMKPHRLQFQKEVTLTVYYGDISLATANEENLDIYNYDETLPQPQWIPLHARIDKATKTLSADINHFSKYALMEDLSKFKIEFSCAENQLFIDNFDDAFNPYIWNAVNYDGWNPYTVSYGTRTFGNEEMTQTAYNGFERAGQETEYAIVTKNTYGYGAGGYNLAAEFRAKFTPTSIYRSNYIGFIRNTGRAGSGYNSLDGFYGVAVTFDEAGPRFVTSDNYVVKKTSLQIDPTTYHTYQIVWTPWFAKLLIDGKLMALHIGNIPRNSVPFVIDSKTWMHGYSAQAVVDYVKLGTACVNPSELQELGITPTDVEAQQFGLPLPDIPPIVVDDYAYDNKWVIAEQAVTLTAMDDKGISNVLYCIGANCTPNIQAVAIRQNQYRLNFTQDMDDVARYLAIDTGSKKSKIGSFVVKLDKTKPIVNDNFDSDNVWISADRTITIYWNDNAEIDWARYCLGADCNSENGIDIYVPNSAYAQLGFTEGISILRYAAKDVAGNISEIKTRTIKIDRTKPVTTIRIDGNKVMLVPEDSISGIQRTYYRIDNSGWALSTEAMPQEGKHTITYFSIDNANNHEEEKTETIIIDTTAPITTDTSDGEWYSNNQNITLNCSDAISGCYITRYCVHDENDSCTPRTIGNNALVDCDEGGVCRKAINYYSVDNVGNIESMKTSKVIKIDKEAPLTADNASELWRNIAQEVSLIAYDYGSGAKETLYCLDRSNECNPAQKNVNTILISDEGLTYLRYYSIDNLNNAEDTKSAFVKIDKTAPTTIDDSVGHWTNTDITITLNANDELSGARGTYYRTNNSNEIAGNAINLTEEGEYAITYYSDDYAGNIEEMKSMTARIDKTKPTITDNYTNSGAWVNAAQIITFNPADSLSGIAEVEYCEGADCIPQTALASPYALNYTTDQDTIVRYSATDNAGNISDVMQFNVKIDKTPPLLELNVNPSTLWPPNKKEVDVFVSGSASDALSGLKEVKFSVQDEYNEIAPILTAFAQSIKLTAWRNGDDKDGRQYTIIAKALDNAGNIAEKQAKVIVPHDMR